MRSKSMIRRSRRHQLGFSLVELLAVIVILGLLAGVVTLSVRGFLIAGKQGVARTEIASICDALETFNMVSNRYPTNEEGIEILADPTKRFPTPILKSVPQDPWGNPYQYNSPGKSGPYEVICLGADGREGGEDAERDISSDGLGEDR